MQTALAGPLAGRNRLASEAANEDKPRIVTLVVHHNPFVSLKEKPEMT
jgi:hypothetical protein